MLSRLIAVYRNPADRRKWLTIASGLFITAALVAFYGFGLAAPWAPLMTIAAVLAGYDIALRAWASLRLRHLSIELLVVVAAIGALFIDNHWGIGRRHLPVHAGGMAGNAHHEPHAWRAEGAA